MLNFTRTAGVVTALALTLSTFSATSASAMERGMHGMGHGGGMMRDGGGMHGMHHHGGMGGYGRAMAIGAGVGVGLMLLNAAAQAQQQPVEVIRERPPSKPKEPRTTPKKPPVVKRDVEKDNNPKLVAREPAIEIVPVRQAHPIYFEPNLPKLPVEAKDCTKCDELWQQIQRYKAMIEEDSRKLAELNAEITNKENAAKAHEAHAKSAKNKIDRDYETKMAEIEWNSAVAYVGFAKNMDDLIKQERAILKDRIAQYEDCLKRLCSEGAQSAAKD